MTYLGYLVFCYILGWAMTGYFVVRLLTHKDIRLQGSGNIGALNSGRVTGVKGFILTFLGDSLKGGIAVVSGIMLMFPEWVLILGLISVVAGHIWPLPFRFQGGKGAATFLGGLLAYDYSNLLFLIIVTGIFYLLLREFTVSGLVAVSLWPLFKLFQGTSWNLLFFQLVLILIILWAHRVNLIQYYKKHLVL
ncbi:MAG: hypothetical protein APF84_10430 [Gracilibacter sp. BRH_c7a]|nr:MAG: hypothetical protein APF84_10430 [Gracilibacter sp. BRH_c7a]